MERLLRWKNEGMSIGSINIAGISNIKIYMLLEVHNLDILCIQETSLAPAALPPILAGYPVIEERRSKGTRGGITTYIKNSIAID